MFASCCAVFLLLSPLPVCCCGDDEPFRQVLTATLFFYVETAEIGVVKQSLCHIGNGSCLQWLISGAFYKLTAFSSEALRTAGF